MKDLQFEIQIQQLAKLVENEINSEQDTERNCRLQNVKEHLRRACMTVASLPFENEDLL